MSEACVFCDRSQFEERLIAEIGNFNVIATLGQITNGYVLLAPKKHFSCVGEASDDELGSLLDLVDKVQRALSLEYHDVASPNLFPVTMFEHGIVGQSIKHAHLHILPVMINLSPRVIVDFPDSKIQKLFGFTHLRNLYTRKQEKYLFWTVPANSESTVCWDPPAPSQYMRLITAEILGCPERGNWRNIDPELDKRLWQETVRRLKPYFP